MTSERSIRTQRSHATTAALFLVAMLTSALAHAVTYSSAPVPFAWVDPSGHNVVSATSSPIALRSLAGCGTSVPNIDDTISDPIPLGFNFAFAGVVVDSVRIISNGRLQFLNQNPSNGAVFDNPTCGFGTPDPFPLPNASIPYTMKVYAADMDPTNIEEAPSYVTRCSLSGAGTGPFGDLPCSIRFATTGTSPNQQLIVTWNNIPEFVLGNSPQGNFEIQALVREDGTFIYQYGDNTSVPGAEIGWQGAANSGDFDVPSISPLPPQNFAIEFYAGGPMSVTATGGTPQSTAVDTAFATQLQVTVTDLLGNPVSGATVNFAAPGSGASATVPASATTDGSGVAVVTATANGAAGSYAVTASVAGVAAPATFNLTNLAGLPASVVATAGTPQTTTINTAFAIPLQVMVTDADGNPVAGAEVDFAAPGSGASATVPASATTDGSGVAGVIATANATAGSYSVTASVAGVATPASFDLTNAPGDPATVTASSGTPQSATIGTPFAGLLQATVTDVGGNPVGNVTVSFAAPGSGASAAVPASAITDGSGVVSVTAIANLTAGSYGVTASVAGVVTPATFSLTNTAGSAASVTATGGTPQSTAVSTAFANPLQATVTDSGGNPVTGVTVSFAVPGSGASATVPATASTNGSGVASVSATANATAGSYSVTASVVSVVTPATFNLTNTAALPTKLAITSVNGGASPTASVAFSVVVQAQDAGGTPENVTADTLVTLSLSTGTGTLGGTLTCTITAGTSSCTVVGVTYSEVETGVVITATRTSGDTLAPGNSASFNVVAGTSPSFVSAVSSKVHGAAGTFDLPLSTVPTNPTTEPRTGPAQTIVFTFDKPIADATVSITEGTATAAPPTFSGNTVIVALTGVSNRQYVTIALSNVLAVDGGTGGGASVRVGFLLGDVNQNRVVTVSDLVLVNAAIAHVVTSANFLRDLNANGFLTVADKLIANNNITKALPAP